MREGAKCYAHLKVTGLQVARLCTRHSFSSAAMDSMGSRLKGWKSSVGSRVHSAEATTAVSRLHCVRHECVWGRFYIVRYIGI